MAFRRRFKRRSFKKRRFKKRRKATMRSRIGIRL